MVWAAVVVSTLVVVEFVFAGVCPHAVKNIAAVKIPKIFLHENSPLGCFNQPSF